MNEPDVLEQADPTHVILRGKRLIYFGGSDYFRLSWHPAVRAAGARVMKSRCISVASSRQTTGNDPVYPKLEAELARFFGFESAALTPAGYTAPLAVAQALEGRFTHVFVDDRAHGCLRDAAILLRAKSTSFHHDDPVSLAVRLRRLGRKSRAIVLTDGLSPLEGTVPPLRDYLDVLPGNATLLVDDAHGAGVLGRTGRGVLEHFDLDDRRIVLTLTLSKAFGCQGGVVLGSRRLRGAILERSRIYSSSTPIPLPIAEAAREALRLIRNGHMLRLRLRQNLQRVGSAFDSRPPGGPARPGPMFTVAPRSRKRQAALGRRLLAAGIHPPLIRYANGPASQFFRFAVSSEHTPAQIALLHDVLEALKKQTGVLA